MPTLFESLQSNLANPDELTTLAPQQKSIASALQAKSGKAASTSTPGASSIGEQATAAAGQTGIDQQRQAGALAATQLGSQVEQQAAKVETAKNALASQDRTVTSGLASQAQGAAEATAASEQQGLGQVAFAEGQRVEQLNVTADQKFRELASEMGMSTDNIFRDFARSNQELAYRKDGARLEEVGFVLAMRDKSYMDELNRIGTERDLKDQLNFKEEMTKLVWGQQLDLAMDDMGFKTILNADQRTWNEKLGGIDIQTALQLAKATLADEQTSQMISGAGNTAKAGVDVYYKMNPNTDTTKQPDKAGDYVNDGDTAAYATNAGPTKNGMS